MAKNFTQVFGFLATKNPSNCLEGFLSIIVPGMGIEPIRAFRLTGF